MWSGGGEVAEVLVGLDFGVRPSRCHGRLMR